MTGYDIYARVCFLLGYYDFLQDNDNAKKQAFCGIINQICEDLKIKGIESLSQEIKLESEYSEALAYGCAMLFSVSIKDDGCAKMYSALYSGKRSSVLSRTDKRYDVLPVCDSGGV